jgi:ELWxxDGT repeat protein
MARRRVIFEGDDTSGREELWLTNGTAAGTVELVVTNNVFTSSGGLQPANLALFNGEIFFQGTDAATVKGLWVSDGTVAGTHEITGIAGANPAGVLPSDITAFNSQILFSGDNTSGNLGLWVSDGTAAGTAGRLQTRQPEPG